MGCLQQLRSSLRKSRWFLNLLAASVAATLIATACSKPKNVIRSDQVVLELHTCERIGLPVRNFQRMNDLSPLQVEIHDRNWKLAAVRTTSVGDFVAEISMHAQNVMPLMAVVKDAGGSEYVVLLKDNAQISLISMKNLLEHSLVKRNKQQFVKIAVSASQRPESKSFTIDLLINEL